MSTLEMSHVDLEFGCRRGGGGNATSGDDEEGSVCSSDADDGSCNSQFYSIADGDASYDDYSFACGSEILEDSALESKRASSVADPSDCVDLESGGTGVQKAPLRSLERDCRICHLSLLSSSPSSGIAMELGCSCKDDLAAAHKHCAETWFKIKGDKTCEICNSVARNVVGPNDTEAGQQQAGEITAVTATTSSAPAPSTCLNGHRFLNFLLACMVFAFVISWLFHFNIPA